MPYADPYRVIRVAFVFATALVPLLRTVTPPKGAQPGGGGH